MKCTICKADSALWESKDHHPFCGPRCKLVDLSKWLGGEYVVAGTRPGMGQVEEIPELEALLANAELDPDGGLLQ